MPRRSPNLVLALLAILLLNVVVRPVSAQVAPSEDDVRRIAGQMQCPVCEGQTVADSNAGLAQDMRAVIRTRLAAGDSDRQILDGFVGSYGDGILTEPPKAGAALLVWLGPLAILLLGGLLLVTLARGWLAHRPRPGLPAAADPATLAGGDEAGVEDELRRFREQFGLGAGAPAAGPRHG